MLFKLENNFLDIFDVPTAETQILIIFIIIGN
jgi:hypothetical protein